MLCGVAIWQGRIRNFLGGYPEGFESASVEIDGSDVEVGLPFVYVFQINTDGDRASIMAITPAGLRQTASLFIPYDMANVREIVVGPSEPGISNIHLHEIRIYPTPMDMDVLWAVHRDLCQTWAPHPDSH